MSTTTDKASTPHPMPMEFRIAAMWEDAEYEWGEACGGPPAWELLAHKIISAMRQDFEAAEAAEQAFESVPLPRSVNMARMMLALGHRYLSEHAPEHLAKREASTEPSAQPLSNPEQLAAGALTDDAPDVGIPASAASTEPSVLSDLETLCEKLHAHWGNCLWIDASELMALEKVIGAGAPPDDAKSRYSAYVKKCEASAILPCSEESFREDANDAARLDWIEQNHAQTYRFESTGTWRISDVFAPIAQASTLREAIDAARLAHTKAGSGK